MQLLIQILEKTTTKTRLVVIKTILRVEAAGKFEGSFPFMQFMWAYCSHTYTCIHTVIHPVGRRQLGAGGVGGGESTARTAEAVVAALRYVKHWVLTTSLA